jgi:hypothetical protein
MNDNIIPIIGLCIELNRPADGSCECGSIAAVIGKGAGPHAAKLDCAFCGKFRGWLPALAADALIHTVTAYGGWPDVVVQPLSPEFNFGAASSTQAPMECKMVKVSEMYPSRFLKEPDLQGEERKVVIQGAMQEKLGIGADAELKLVITYKGWKKVHALNKIVSTFFADALGDDSDDWAGKIVILYPTTQDFQGKTHRVIRVRMPTARDKMPVSTSTPPPSAATDDGEEPPFDA